MARTRIALALLPLVALMSAFLAADAGAAKIGVSSAKALSTDSSTTTTRTGKGSTKPVISLETVTPGDGSTVSGAIAWSVTVAGTASRVDFAVDGTVGWSQSSGPYAYGGANGTLDTTKLVNGAHTLTATAFGAGGVTASSRVTVTVANAAPAAQPEPELQPEPEPGSGPIYWGAWIGDQLTGKQAPWDMTAVAKFEGMTGKPLSLVQFGQPFSNCSGSSCSFYSFPWTPLEDVRKHGAIPVVSWSSQSIPSSVNEPDYQLSDVISGRYDAYIREFASKAKSWGHPFFLRFNWEMNGNWFPWSEGVNGNKQGEYVAAWRHVHDIFTAVGATNVTWIWCPNIKWNGTIDNLASMYPGDAYVDWTGLDGYNWGTNPARQGKWETFRQLYRETYRHVTETVAPTKPMMLAEIASSEFGGSKAIWIREMLSQVPTEYPKIRALLWFERFDDGMDWPLETSSSATTAFAEGIQNPAYESNTFSSLGLAPIEPAS